MVVMQERGLQEVLTTDKHFQQAGFQIFLALHFNFAFAVRNYDYVSHFHVNLVPTQHSYVFRYALPFVAFLKGKDEILGS